MADSSGDISATNPDSSEGSASASGSGSTPAWMAFASTHWSLVLAAGEGSSPTGARALEQLCRLYWPPVYAYIRRRGHSLTDAEDLTQSFFAQLLERGVVGKADPQRGRFRTFLLTCLKHHLIDQHRQGQARQWRKDAIPVVGAQIEPSLVANGIEAMDPERVFARQWGLTLLGEVLEGLRQQMAQEGQEEWFERLRPGLCGDDGTVPYRELAERLGMGEGALRMRVRRLRERYGERLRETIAQTVSSPAEVDAEIRYLMEVLG